jgi:tetratricopeptide (TPR) repeat protein
MRRGAAALLIALLALAGLGLTLRHDLAHRAWRQARERLAAGDRRAALALLDRARRDLPQQPALAFDTGVAHYRLGDFRQARALFGQASAAADPLLRGAALYNLGNCLIREGDQAAAGDRQAARRLYQEALGRYRQALLLAPQAADARHNLAVAADRLAAGAGAGGPGGDGAPARSGRRPVEAKAKGGGAGEKGERQGEKGERQGEEASGRRSDRGDEAAGRSPGKPGPAAAASSQSPAQLTRTQAEQLLSEARRREPGFAALAPRGEGRLSPPDKDW